MITFGESDHADDAEAGHQGAGGAPQTGGTDGPVDDSSSGRAVAAGAMGVLAVGGAGMVLARRRSRG
ncbi:hypothetical protein AB0F91_12665 [Amycolatopsis sp. NPDC023774]|uniref:hypothetical protein n=1 Tax=Amycolatopsis sp. NPDC023774 TaxID=3155015 RepID=UPI0033CBF13D